MSTCMRRHQGQLLEKGGTVGLPRHRPDDGWRAPAHAADPVPHPGLLPGAAATGVGPRRRERESRGVRDRDGSAAHEPRKRLGARTSGRSSRSARPPLSSSRWPCWHREAPRNDAAGRRWRPSADLVAATSGRSRSRLISRSWPDGSALWSPTRIPTMGARLSISAGRNRRRIA